MVNIEYKNVLVEIISEIKDRPSYLAGINLNDSNSCSKEFYEGMLQAYFFVLDGIIEYVNSSDELSLEDLGLDEFDPMAIYKYLPK